MIFGWGRKEKIDRNEYENHSEALLSAKEYLETSPKVEFDPYPVYDGRVMSVLGLLETDLKYMEHHEQIADKPVGELTLKEIATMYTFIERGERFCDGHIASYIEDGTMLKLVNRHLELIGAVPTGRNCR